MRNLDAWLDYIGGQEWQNIDLGLGRMHTMLARLQVERPAPRVITVAGTNGKGSTCLACEALLLAPDCRVGSTLSPHLLKFNERIRIDGAELDDEQICQAFAAVEAARQDLPLTYFEYAALAAMWSFKQYEVDVAILEIGLGGRLDAFNAVAADVAVITSIGLDHQSYLGDTREAIGAEKAGILRAGQKVALGENMPRSVLRAVDALQLQPAQVGVTASYPINRTAGTWSIVENQVAIVKDLPLGGCAPHNLLLAYLAIRQIARVSPAKVREVAAELVLPGRMQVVRVGGRNWVLDVAHNPDGVRFLAQALQQRGWQPQLIICGMFADKDHVGVAEALTAQFSCPWFLVDTQGERGFTAAKLLAALTAANLNQRVSFKAVKWTDLRREVDTATAPEDVILVLGSFNVIEQFDQVDID